MELQFDKTAWPCLMTVAAQVKNEEQTQEVRLGDHLPDIGKVIASWGQVLLRGKEWRGSGMAVSTGVMAWVLYAPEDGSEPRLVEVWIPVQLKWDFPETNRDGVIIAHCQLSCVDARCVSARKLMVRAVVSVLAEALVPDNVDVWTPGMVPDDVHLLKRTYPVRLPREAGERPFAMDETVTLPSQTARVIRCSLRPEIGDTNVVAGKAVFRGTAALHLLCEDLSGNLYTQDQEIAFSQFADLDRSYDGDVRIRVIPALTNLEMELEAPDRLHIQAGCLGQFVVLDRPALEVVEDAYSNRRAVEIRKEELQLPTELDHQTKSLRLTQEDAPDGERILDMAFLCGHPRVKREEDAAVLEQTGVFQILCASGGELKGSVKHVDGQLRLPAQAESMLWASAAPGGNSQAVLTGGTAELRGEVSLCTVTTAGQGIPMVTGLSLGEPVQPDPNRPSMILRRSAGQELWELAKAAGSTVEEIRRANQLQGEPEDDRLLLIPVL